MPTTSLESTNCPCFAGLLGITLDHNDVFLVSIHETIRQSYDEAKNAKSYEDQINLSEQELSESSPEYKHQKRGHENEQLSVDKSNNSEMDAKRLKTEQEDLSAFWSNIKSEKRHLHIFPEPSHTEEHTPKQIIKKERTEEGLGDREQSEADHMNAGPFVLGSARVFVFDPPRGLLIYCTQRLCSAVSGMLSQR